MKILYVEPNVRYMNPTSSLFPGLLLSQYPDAAFYGPGYVSPKELEMGLERWIDKNGPFDAIIIGLWVPFVSDRKHDEKIAASIQFVKKFTVSHGCSEPVLKAFYEDVLKSFTKLPIPLKLVSDVISDSYAATQQQVDIVLESGITLIGPNHQFSKPMSEWPTDISAREYHYKKKKDRLTDAWYNFLSEYPEKIVTFCHYVGQHEINFNELDGRKWDVSVPGVEYARRRDAIKSISKTSKSCPKTYFHLYRFANKIGVPVYSTTVLLQLYNTFFYNSLISTKMIYTATGGSGIVPRKYVEIPAAGAVLVCNKCNGFDELGYVDGENCLVADAAELREMVSRVTDWDEYQSIANAGRRLMMESHSLPVRGQQLKQCLEALSNNSYGGAVWEKGKLFVKDAAGNIINN